MRRDDMRGLEFDWWAIDQDDHVALFCTAGQGDIPTEVLKAYGDQPTDPDLRDLIPQLVPSGPWQEEGRGPGTCREFRDLGARGVFVFDGLLAPGPYERIIRPANPVRLHALPTGVREAVVLVRLSQVCFAEVDAIKPRDLVACE